MYLSPIIVNTNTSQLEFENDLHTSSIVMILYDNVPFYAVVCLSLSPVSNGMISYSDPRKGVGSVAHHTCDTGYTLIGGSSRTCQSDGTWSGSAPTCVGN